MGEQLELVYKEKHTFYWSKTKRISDEAKNWNLVSNGTTGHQQ